MMKIPQGWALQCKGKGGEIVSGVSGDLLCTDPSTTGMKWPKISACGQNASDTNWIVKDGASESWDFVLVCTNNSNCNGPENALCNKDGCVFSGTCN